MARKIRVTRFAQFFSTLRRDFSHCFAASLSIAKIWFSRALRCRPAPQPHARPSRTRARVRRRQPSRLRRFGRTSPAHAPAGAPNGGSAVHTTHARAAESQTSKRASSSFARATHGTRGRDGGSVGRDEAVQRAPGTSRSARWFPRATTTLDPLDRASTAFSKCPPRSRASSPPGAHAASERTLQKKPTRLTARFLFARSRCRRDRRRSWRRPRRRST